MPLTGDGQVNKKAFRIAINSRQLARFHPLDREKTAKKQLHQIAVSIQSFGFTNPVLIDQHDIIIAGHGRVDAAKLLNRSTVPTIRIEHLSEAQKRAYVLADNKIAANAGWDPEILAI